MPYSNNEYLDPIHIIWRSGNPDDPYIDKVEYLKVVNNKVVLTEIPDRFYRVRISGLIEVNIDKITAKSLSDNQFAVDYASGYILVHETQEAQTLNVQYKGRGFIQYPSSRIYHQDQFNDVVLSLEDIINRALRSVELVDSRITDYQLIRDLLIEKLDDIAIATDFANESAEEAVIATELAKDAYKTTRLVFKTYVNSFGQIALQYPNPEVGWTVQVYNTGVRYRWDGINWVAIDLFGGNLPDASLTTRGLMSIATYKQLQDLEKKVIDNQIDTRVLVFSMPYISIGINNLIARFPFKGEIVGVRAICLRNGMDANTEIDVETTTDFLNWNTIFNGSYIKFLAGSNVDDGGLVITPNTISSNQAFRVNVKSASQNIEAVSIEIKIKVKN